MNLGSCELKLLCEVIGDRGLIRLCWKDWSGGGVGRGGVEIRG